MEYTPRYPQPFTLTEALHFDISTITDEIARLENSLAHLHTTQTILKDGLDQDYDEELSKAYSENQLVIGSQEERISILKMALADKGIVQGPHYDQKPPPDAAPTDRDAQAASDDGQGVYL